MNQCEVNSITLAEIGGETANEDAVFGSYEYTETVGMWMKYGRHSGGQLLSPFISTDSFEFTPAEYLDLRERLARTIRKYARLPRASVALENLNTGFFRHQTLEESRTFLTGHLEHFLFRARSLYRQYLLAVNGYARRSALSGRRSLTVRQQELNNLRELINRPVTRKDRRKKTTEVRNAWSEYRKRWLQDDTDPKAEPDSAALDAETASLQEMISGLSRREATATLALNHLTVAPGLGDPAEFQQLATDLESLIREIDEAGIYQLPLAGNIAATASRQLQRVEQILGQLSTTHAHLGKLDDFYARRHFWYAQPARLRRLMVPLLELPEADWEVAFSAWYFDRCLEKFPLAQVPQFRTDELAASVKEDDFLPSAGGKINFISSADSLPEGTRMVFDLTGGSRPEGFTGKWYGWSPLTDVAAQFHALAGTLDARLTLLQPFFPLGPAPWSAVTASEPPPDCAGRVGVQAAEGQPWKALPDWTPEACSHLRLYLPPQISEEDGTSLLRCFDQLVQLSEQLTVFHNWSSDTITQALLTDGVNPEFLAAALLRAAEACTETPFDQAALVAVGQEILTRCGVPIPEEHPLAKAMLPVLQQELPDHFFTLHQPWRDTFLPLLVQSPGGRKTVLLPGGRLPGLAEARQEALRQRELRIAGMACLEIDAVNCWENAPAEARRLAEKIME